MDLSNNTFDVSQNTITAEHRQIIKYVCLQTSLNEQSAYNGLIKYKGDYKKVIHLANIHEMAQIITRQTTYTLKESIIKLQEHKGEPLDVIKEFMGVKPMPEEEEPDNKSTNQMIYSEIRNFMDTVNRGYRKRKLYKETMEKLQAHKKK